LTKKTDIGGETRDQTLDFIIREIAHAYALISFNMHAHPTARHLQSKGKTAITFFTWKKKSKSLAPHSCD
jgi:hypothetical protein